MSGVAYGAVSRLKKVASTYVRSSALAALSTIVTPAANVRGVWVYHALVDGNTLSISLMSKASAPVSENDTAACHLVRANTAYVFVTLDTPVFLPPGIGLYEQAGAATSSTRVHVIYEVL
jgi:hypothetical protein